MTVALLESEVQGMDVPTATIGSLASCAFWRDKIEPLIDEESKLAGATTREMNDRLSA